MSRTRFLLVAAVVIAMAGFWSPRAQEPLTLEVTDFFAMPMTGTVDGAGNIGSLARINSLREEPGGTKRLFVNDLNGPLYIIDRNGKVGAPYLDFNGRGTHTGLFHRFTFEAGYANGFIAFQFDPAYTTNGRFYSIHLEEPAVEASPVPDNTHFPGVKLDGYTNTPAVKTPGEIQREAVVIEWTDSNIGNATFEGTAREILRVQLNTRIHPMGDMIFNPTAKRGDPDWRVLYIGCGDGGSGEQTTGMRLNPQRLDTLVGKILRVIPDLQEHTADSTVSDNGRYRVPRDNPFTSLAAARPEIWANGFRNPHRLAWDVDPVNPANNHLIAASIGLHSWETVNIVHKGANYGYSLREGNQLLKPDNTTAPLPDMDDIPVRISDTVTHGTIKPTYPVVEYDHSKDGGDAITGGFVYRGQAIPQLRGKYIFGDITTGKIWYADFKEMLAADDGKPSTLAKMHEIRILWDNPSLPAGSGKGNYPTMFPIVEAAYHARGGKDPDLPGSSTVSGSGRADIRFAMDASGELFILSKCDGMIRKLRDQPRGWQSVYRFIAG